MIVNEKPAIPLSSEDEAHLEAFMPAPSMEQVIRKDLSSITEIRDLRIEQENGETFVWIAMENPSRDLRYRVYDMQAALAAAYPGVFMNFNLIPA